MVHTQTPDLSKTNRPPDQSPCCETRESAPDSNGLFQRAILQSGQYQSFFSRASCAQTLQTASQADATFATLAQRAGCSTAADVISCLHAVPTQTFDGRRRGA